MQMYPAYSLRDVLNEYAITVFSLLNAGYKAKNKHYLMLAKVYGLPYTDKETATKFTQQLQWAAKGADDILNPSTEGSSTSDIRKALGE